MLQLPTTHTKAHKIVLDLHGENPGGLQLLVRCLKSPQPQVELQSIPELIIYRSMDIHGTVLHQLAYDKDCWVIFDPERHQPENFRKPKPKPVVKKKKPIPKAGPDAVRIKPKLNEETGKVITARVSNHIEPRQNTGPGVVPPPMSIPRKSGFPKK